MAEAYVSNSEDCFYLMTAQQALMDCHPNHR